MNNREVTAADVAHAAKQASFALAASPSKTRNSALLAIAAALRAKAGQIFKANDIDMRQAEKEGLAAPALKRLKFDPKKGRTEYLDPPTSGHGTFGVRVNKTCKSFIWLYSFHGAARRLTIGQYPDLSLAEARAKAGAGG